MVKDIVFLINKSEITAGTRGASLGPEAIIAATRNRNKTFFGDFPVEEVENVNYLLDNPVKYPFAKRIFGLSTMYETLNTKVSNTLKQGKFPLILAGDHGSAGGTIAGIKTAFPEKRLGVIWIDAHADLHTPYTTPSGNMHGMPLATALNVDNLECKINEIDTDTFDCWNHLKMIGNIAPKILPSDLVLIGVRDTEEQEDRLIDRLQIKKYTIQEVNQLGTELIVNEINERLNQCDLIYVSFDVDSMDPELTSHGTGTPVDKGLTPKQAEELLVGFAKNEKIVSFEFVEVNPCLDEKMNKMAEVASELVEAIINEVKK